MPVEGCDVSGGVTVWIGVHQKVGVLIQDLSDFLFAERASQPSFNASHHLPSLTGSLQELKAKVYLRHGVPSSECSG